MTERYIIHSEVTYVQEQKERVYMSGIGESAVFNEVSLGYFIYLKGSHEAIHVGMEKPSLKVGAKMKITIEEV